MYHSVHKPRGQGFRVEILRIDEISVARCHVGAKVALDAAAIGVQNGVHIARIVRIAIIEELFSVVLFGHGKMEVGYIWVHLKHFPLNGSSCMSSLTRTRAFGLYPSMSSQIGTRQRCSGT